MFKFLFCILFVLIFIEINQINGEKECNCSATDKWEVMVKGSRFKRGAKMSVNCSCIGKGEESSEEDEGNEGRIEGRGEGRIEGRGEGRVEGRGEGRVEGRSVGRRQIPIGTEGGGRREEQMKRMEEIFEEIGGGVQRRSRSLERGEGVERLRERGGSLGRDGRIIGRIGREVEDFEGWDYEESSSRRKGKQKVGESSTKNGKTKRVLYICDNYYYSHVQFNVNNLIFRS
ncbi:unnamed protein product [Meloidogyne enterolobii]|uniref:Uncharacterized protein n=1 Tax=Meloidogyne enterolobii TaxID=390850 RepID=A0ACB0Z1H3_MELEN